MIRTLLVDDHPALRAGLGTVLRAEPGIVPVAVVATAGEALTEVERWDPDVAVVDYHLQDGDGLSLCRRLKSRSDPPAVLVYSGYADAQLTIPALVAGADGVVNKVTPAEDLFEAIRIVAKGDPIMPPVSRELLRESAAKLDDADLPILGMLIDRTSASEVAGVLGISDEELARRRSRMLDRLAVDVPAANR